jgi:membrane protein
MWFSIGVVRALRLAHTVAWGVRRERFRRPIHGALLFTFAAVAVILVSGAAQVLREQTDGDLLVTFSIVVVYVAFALLLMLLLPHRDTPWTALLPGAVLVGVGALGLQAFTALYLAPKIGRSSELYGALGAATVILLWLYIIARLITLSAFLNATLWERRHGAG